MTVFVAWLWQGLAIAGVTTAVLWTLPRLRPATRHATWWVALGAVVAVPLVLAVGSSADQAPQVSQPVVLAGPSAAVVLPAVPGWVAAAIAGIWSLATLAGLARVALGWHAVHRLKRTATPFDPARLARLPLWSSHAAVARRAADLRISDAITGACALGFRRPVVLVGRPLFRALDDEALDRVLMHEQAHLDRYDDWTQLLQAVVGAVAGLHPAIWWLSRQIDHDREAACDNLVVARTGEARAYAAALLQAAAAAAAARAVPAIVPGATAGRSALRRRVSRVLDARPVRGERLAIAGPAVVAMPIGVLLACLPLAPLLAVADAVQQSGPTAAALPSRARVHLLTTASALPASSGAGSQGRTAPPPRARAARTPVAAAPSSLLAADRHTAAAEPMSRGDTTAPAPLESRTLPAPAEAPGAIRGIAGPGAPLQLLPAERSPWQALATSPATAAKDVASRLASGAGRSGVSLGRAFTRTGKAIAASF